MIFRLTLRPLFLLAIAFAFLAANVPAALAQLPPAGGAPASVTDGTCPLGSVCLENPIAARSIPVFISDLLRGAIGIVGALALLVFFYGGFVWLTSRGEAAKITAAKEAMKWAAIGLVIIFTSYGLVRFVFKAFTG